MIELNNIHKSFGKNEARVDAIKGITLTVGDKEMVAVMGKSGSGKSTLLNIIGGMMSMDDGEYIYQGRPVNFKSQKAITDFRRNEIGFVVQYFALVEDLNVYDNVALPLKFQGYSRKKIKRMVWSALEELGIEDKVKAYPNELSGGQQQRVAIARAIVKNPGLILADEPTGALDQATGEEVQNIFSRLNESGKTVIIVTHDKNVAERCGRIIRIKDGMIDLENTGSVAGDFGGMAE